MAIQNFANSSIKTGYPRHTFWDQVATTNLTVDYLVLAGGGGGGYDGAGGGSGGGGAGGLRSTVTATGGGGSLESPLILALDTLYTVTVGAGGVGGLDGLKYGMNGGNSVFSTIT